MIISFILFKIFGIFCVFYTLLFFSFLFYYQSSYLNLYNYIKKLTMQLILFLRIDNFKVLPKLINQLLINSIKKWYLLAFYAINLKI